MFKTMIGKAMKSVPLPGGFDAGRLRRGVLDWCLRSAAKENGLGEIMSRLRTIEPDILKPDMPGKEHWELKRRMLHAFQCKLMLRALAGMSGKKFTVVDIGGEGTHMLYLRELTRGTLSIDTVEINLDPDFVERVRARGQRAVLCRGEDLHRHFDGERIDLFTAFETIEHLHDPALFLRRLAKRFSCPRMVVTVPYVRRSRVGLLNVRQGSLKDVAATDEHIFELSPGDWRLLMLHAGWRVGHDAVCRQYPNRVPLVRSCLSRLWRATEFEGFWGAVLEKDTTFSDRYRHWDE